ncbi:ATP-binding protein [Streptomyces sp. NPDC002888]|uniref:ATP-binding protein n=1 Tax=Streptomyces sp. NPDC002888 TaxID=3364668 RepID=UPI003689D5F0
MDAAVRDPGGGPLPKVFERFTRADRRRTEGADRRRTEGAGGGTGTGLGLSIVAAVAEAHGGSVTLDSSPGSTTFTVRLPTGARPATDRSHSA